MLIELNPILLICSFAKSYLKLQDVFNNAKNFTFFSRLELTLQLVFTHKIWAWYFIYFNCLYLEQLFRIPVIVKSGSKTVFLARTIHVMSYEQQSQIGAATLCPENGHSASAEQWFETKIALQPISAPANIISICRSTSSFVKLLCSASHIRV